MEEHGEDKLTSGQFVDWLLRHEVCHRLVQDKRQAWINHELSKAAKCAHLYPWLLQHETGTTTHLSF